MTNDPWKEFERRSAEIRAELEAESKKIRRWLIKWTVIVWVAVGLFELALRFIFK